MYGPYKLVLINIILALILILGLLLYKYIFKKPINLFVLLIIISFLPIISIFREGTYQAGDLTLHSVFLQSFYENIRDGIFTPQWAGGLCGGYGCPVFLFEYIMPYYMGTFFHIVGFSYIDSIKLFLATSFILSGISMYIFIKDDYGELSAFVGAMLYLFAPIHLTEMHFRVSVGTVASFIFIPLSFLLAKKSLSGKLIFIILGAINFVFLIFSHSSITFVIVPVSLLYAYLKRKKLKEILYPIISYALGVGLSAYYILPAVFEIKYTWYSQTIQNVTDFKPFFEYIFSPARYGLLFQGNQGELRLIVGYAQLIVVFSAIYLLFKKKYQKREHKIILLFLLFFFICFVLMLSFTKPLWDTIFFLRSFVLPWRMLVPIAFATAVLGATVVKYWNKKWVIVFCLFAILSTILNWGNRTMVPIDPNAYNKHWSLYTEYFEPNNPLYLARYNSRGNKIQEIVLHRPSHLEILSGKGKIKEISRTQIDHEYLVYAETALQLSENTYYFPGWTVFANNKKIPLIIENKKHFGTLVFTLPKGLYEIQSTFLDTPIRTIGRIISWTTLFVILFSVLVVFYKNFLSVDFFHKDK